jgi:deoxyribodipyrimidine photo-lyase
MMQNKLVWLRRDLRIDDNTALYHALQACKNINDKLYIAFVFDTQILNKLDSDDRRITFIYDTLISLKAEYQNLILLYGDPTQQIPDLCRNLNIHEVYTNHDYEHYAIERDSKIAANIKQNLNISFHSYKDNVIFEKGEVLSKTSSPYTVFTPYKKAWLQKLANINASIFEAEDTLLCKNIDFSKLKLHLNTFEHNIPSLESMGFVRQDLKIKSGINEANILLQDFLSRMHNYKQSRDFPAVKGVSYLSTYLRFGTISIRRLVEAAYKEYIAKPANEGAATWLSELIWREFYAQIIHNFPHVQHGKSFNEKYEDIVWRDINTDDTAMSDFMAWCEGKTGYPIVDAGMRQLNQTGYMHNRLRMVTASFLIKNIGIDWRHGEKYFAKKLLDFDFASNNGGWQWCASSGCDAQPYFRIFNPMLQSVKFDEQAKFILKYVPELARVPLTHIHSPWEIGKYITPIIDYKKSREDNMVRYSILKKI